MTEVQQNVDHSSVYNTPPLDAQCRQLSMETAVNYNRSKTPDDSPNLDLRKEQELSPASSQGHRELPPHWERVQSEQHGRYYYWNRVTDKTTWKFPEEDAKEHKKIVRSHNYVNVEVSPKRTAKRSKTPNVSPTKSPGTVVLDETGPEDQSTINSGTNINGSMEQNSIIKLSASETSTDDALPNGNVSPCQEPLSKPRRRSDKSYVSVELTNSTTTNPASTSPLAVTNLPNDHTPISPNTVTSSDTIKNASREARPSLPPLETFPYEEIDIGSTVSTKPLSSAPGLPRERSMEIGSPTSPTPPLPSRNYSDSDIRFSPPPAVPFRGYELSPSPPPLPNRRYSSSDLKGQTADEKDRSAKWNTFGTHSSRPKSSTAVKTSIETHQLEHEMSDMGNEYTLVDRSQKTSQTPRPQGSKGKAPPLPLRARQRMAQDAEEDGYSTVLEHSRERSYGKYIELDVQTENDPKVSSTATHPSRNSVAYSVVELPGERERPPLPDPKLRQPLAIRKILTPPRPRPYEVPSPANSLDNLLDPGYEQIKDKEAKPNDRGYMEVKKDSQLHYQRTASQERLKTRKLSLKELYSVPSTSSDQATNEQRENPSSGRDSPLSQDSVFGSSQTYDVPANSKRLQRLNVTLPRGTNSNASGYARLDLSREAILLRSGVTLRRYGQGESVSSLLSYRSKRDGSVDEGSDGSSGDGTDHDDGLEPVHKAIKSLETSLGVSADNLSGSPDLYIKMARAPVGPPSWKQVRRRPHAYEEVNSQEDDQGDWTSQEARKTSADVEMDWDETDLGIVKTKSGMVKEGSRLRSASQPNLLRDMDGELDSAFPHLKKPPRVSDEAFQLRKLRLIKHKYEDVDMAEWPDVGLNAESVGDVNALTSAIKESWLESDQTPGDGKLPKGWQRMKDEKERLYYWHVPTGRTQYSNPTSQEIKRLSLSVDESHSVRSSSSPPSEANGKRRPFPTFSARFLGSLDVSESELVPGQCVKVVHTCINRATAEPDARVSSNDKVRLVFLQVHNTDLCWLDPETSTPTTTQPINKIRVWGIGLENERDFGYVARDTDTKKHKCHVFRCERPARAVARALLEAHQKEKQERRSKRQEVVSPRDSVSSGSSSVGQKERSGLGHSASPDVPDRGKDSPQKRSDYSHSVSPSSDLSGKAHPHRYERIPCTYIGSCDVPQAMGMNIVNDAVETLCSKNRGRWLDVNLDVATSHIKISDVKSDTVIREHRVRFLCFLGIAKDDRFCGYILDNGVKDGEKHFQFHGFRKEPNADRLCLALHNACQARYQRVLDSNQDTKKEREREPSVSSTKETSPPERGRTKSTPSLFGRLGSLKKAKKPLIEDESKLQSFVVQYLGCQAVSKPEGLNTVKIPVQQMAVPKAQNHSIPPHLVEFDVTPGGLYITDPQKRLFSKKNFAVKNITYVVRIRNYFAFISRDGGKLMCHVFLENEVDAGTVVSTIERMLAPDNSQSPTK